MKRYAIELTSMQWGMVALDLSKIPLADRSGSTDSILALIQRTLDHVADPYVDLPYNIREVE